MTVSISGKVKIISTEWAYDTGDLHDGRIRIHERRVKGLIDFRSNCF